MHQDQILINVTSVTKLCTTAQCTIPDTYADTYAADGGLRGMRMPGRHTAAPGTSSSRGASSCRPYPVTYTALPFRAGEDTAAQTRGIPGHA